MLRDYLVNSNVCMTRLDPCIGNWPGIYQHNIKYLIRPNSSLKRENWSLHVMLLSTVWRIYIRYKLTIKWSYVYCLRAPRACTRGPLPHMWPGGEATGTVISTGRPWYHIQHQAKPPGKCRNTMSLKAWIVILEARVSQDIWVLW